MNTTRVLAVLACLMISVLPVNVSADATETVRLMEHNIALRSGDEPVSVNIKFEGVEVRIVENAPTEPTD